MNGKALCSLLALTAVFAILAFGPSIPSEAQAGEAVAKLIAQLGADDFRAREQASKELEKLGSSVLPALRKAATANFELEVKCRLEKVVVRIENALLETEEKHWQKLDVPRQGIKDRLVRILRRAPGMSDRHIVSAIYLIIVGRSPNAEEISRAQKQFKESNSRFVPALQIARSLIQSEDFKAEVAAANGRVLKAEKELVAETEFIDKVARLNSDDFEKLIDQVATSLNKVAKTDEEFVQLALLLVQSRFPEWKESSSAVAHLENAKNRASATAQIIWAMMNTKEFLLTNR